MASLAFWLCAAGRWYFALLDDGRLAGALKESALVGLATAALATPIGLSAALAYRAMTRLRGVFLLVILSAMFVPGTIEGLGLSATLRVVGLAPSWVTIAIGHLLWTLPFAAGQWNLNAAHGGLREGFQNCQRSFNGGCFAGSTG